MSKNILGKKYQIPPRNDPEKPGRTLTVIWDDLSPLKPKFKNKFSYQVLFEKRGNIAGNHIHKKKSEIFIPTKGSFRVFLFDPIAQTKESVTLKTGEALYVPARIAHVVIAKSKGAILTVIANHRNEGSDEFKYLISTKEKK